VLAWLTSVLFNDQCGPAALNVWGWVALAALFGGSGILMGVLLTTSKMFDGWDLRLFWHR
jgi:hypothetical protein